MAVSETTKIAPLRYSEDWTFRFDLQQFVPSNLPGDLEEVRRMIPLIEERWQNAYDKLGVALVSAPDSDATDRIRLARLSIRTLFSTNEVAVRSLGSGDDAAIRANWEAVRRSTQDTLETLGKINCSELEQMRDQLSPDANEMLVLLAAGQDVSSDSPQPRELTYGDPYHSVNGGDTEPLTAEGKKGKSNRKKTILGILGAAAIVAGVVAGVALIATGVGAGAGVAVLVADASITAAVIGGAVAAGVMAGGIGYAVGGAALKKGMQQLEEDDE